MTISRFILLIMRNFSNRRLQKPKIHILCSVTFSWKSRRLWDNAEKCGGAREAADGKHQRVACWLSEDTRVQALAIACVRAQKYVTVSITPRRWTVKYGTMVEWRWRRKRNNSGKTLSQHQPHIHNDVNKTGSRRRVGRPAPPPPDPQKPPVWEWGGVCV
jgi:hypothetical protein